jgi:hypothetical protein
MVYVSATFKYRVVILWECLQQKFSHGRAVMLNIESGA